MSRSLLPLPWAAALWSAFGAARADDAFRTTVDKAQAWVEGHVGGLDQKAIAAKVVDPDGKPIEGVTVTATSPALQGQKVTVTNVQGDYLIKFLPAGTYTVRFELEAFDDALDQLRRVANRLFAALALRAALRAFNTLCAFARVSAPHHPE